MDTNLDMDTNLLKPKRIETLKLYDDTSKCLNCFNTEFDINLV